MFESVRARLTLWYTGVLALVLLVFALTSYFFLARTLIRRTDETLAEMGRAFAETLVTEQQELLANRASSPRNDQSNTATSDADAALIDAASEYRLKDYQLLVYDRTRQIVATSSGFTVEQQEMNTPVWTLAPVTAGLTKLLDKRARKLVGSRTSLINCSDGSMNLSSSSGVSWLMLRMSYVRLSPSCGARRRSHYRATSALLKITASRSPSFTTRVGA